MTFGPVDGQPEKWVLVLLSLLFRWKFMWTPPEKNRNFFQNGDLRLTELKKIKKYMPYLIPGT